MTNMIPASNKLRARGIRIIMTLANLDAERAAVYFEAADGNAAHAVELARRERPTTGDDSADE